MFKLNRFRASSTSSTATPEEKKTDSAPSKDDTNTNSQQQPITWTSLDIPSPIHRTGAKSATNLDTSTTTNQPSSPTTRRTNLYSLKPLATSEIAVSDSQLTYLPSPPKLPGVNCLSLPLHTSSLNAMNTNMNAQTHNLKMESVVEDLHKTSEKAEKLLPTVPIVVSEHMQSSPGCWELNKN